MKSMKGMKYDTILFDADGTLLNFSKGEREALCEALLELGVTADEDMIATYSQINEGLWKKLEKKEITKEVLVYHRFELLFDRYGIVGDPQKMAKAYMTSLSQKGYLLEGARELCERLYGKVRLYIVTNGIEFIQRGRFNSTGLGRYFNDVFISEIIGCEKPDVQYFAYVAEHIPNFCGEKTLIVGDSLTSDIKGGIAYGIDTCWFNPKAKEAPEDMREQITFEARNFDDVYGLITQGERL